MDELRFAVMATVEAVEGGDDGAYGLIGTWTAKEFLEALAESLKEPILKSLLRGGQTPVGHVLKIEIRDAK